MAKRDAPDAAAKTERRKERRKGCLQLLLPGLFVLAGIGGCIHHDERAADRALAKLSVGMSASEVIAQLGEPGYRLTRDEWRKLPEDERIYFPERDVVGEIWVYEHHQWGAWWMFMEILVYLDEAGKVEFATVFGTT